MHIKLWHGPLNGGWIWFSKENIKRLSLGWIKKDKNLWWAILGFSGAIILQTFPWEKPNEIKLKGFDEFYDKNIKAKRRLFTWKCLVDAFFVGLIIFIILNFKDVIT